MSLTGVKCCATGRDETFEHCMGCALTGSPHACVHPFPLIAFMKDKDDSRVDAGLSVTQLLGCPRQSILKQEIGYTEDPGNMWAMFRGALGHEMMGRFAKYVPDGFMEERLIGHYEDPETGELVTITGQPDWVVPVDRGDPEVQECIITDFKSSKHPVGQMTQPKADHVKQVHLYASLLWNGQVMATGQHKSWWCREGRIVYFDMNGSKTFSFPVNVDDGDQMATELVKPFVGWQVNRVLPPVLPKRVVTSKRTGATQVSWHPLCGYCPVRDACERLEAEGK